MFNLEDPDPNKKEIDSDAKVLAGVLAFFTVIMIIFFLVMAVSIIQAFWQAGFISTLIWVVSLGIFAYIIRLVYRVIIHNGWVNKI